MGEHRAHGPRCRTSKMSRRRNLSAATPLALRLGGRLPFLRRFGRLNTDTLCFGRIRVGLRITLSHELTVRRVAMDDLPWLICFTHGGSMSVVDMGSRARPKPDVWQCRCGCYTFWLYSTGAAYCSSCREEAHTMRGFWQIPEKPSPTPSRGEIIALLPLKGQASATADSARAPASNFSCVGESDA